MPIIHALDTLPVDQCLVLRNLLTQRRASGKSTPAHKQMILDMLHAAGSLESTLTAIRLLQAELDRELEAVEVETGVDNWELRVVVELVKV